MIAECDDYVNSIQVPQLVKAPIINGGTPEMNGIRPVMYTGGFCVVFPYRTNTKKYAVRCWHAYLDGAQDRAREISKYLSSINLPYFVDFQYIEEGVATSKGIMPIVVMDWVDAKPLKKYIQGKLHDPMALDKLASDFMRMAQDLHAKNISHGDLQHGNIMVKNSGDIVLVDYDSMYVPQLAGYNSQICGLKGYQHPARWNEKKVSPKADYFSELIIYTSIKALAKYPHLWEKLQIEDTDTLLFSEEDIDSKGYSNIFEEISKDIYLKKLVEAIREELSHSSIDELLPLELVEPNESEKKEKKKLIKAIKEIIDNIVVDNKDIEVIKQWLSVIDEETVCINEVEKHYNEALIVQKKEAQRKEREKIIGGITSEWESNGYTPQKSIIETRSTVEEQRKEWEDNGNTTSTNTPKYNSSEIDDTRNEWNS